MNDTRRPWEDPAKDEFFSVDGRIDSSRNRFIEESIQGSFWEELTFIKVEQVFDDKIDDKASFEPGFHPVNEDPIEATARFDAPARMPSSSYLYDIW